MLRSDPMDEPGNPLFFEFGKTREDAISRLVIADLGHLLPNKMLSDVLIVTGVKMPENWF